MRPNRTCYQETTEVDDIQSKTRDGLVAMVWRNKCDMYIKNHWLCALTYGGYTCFVHQQMETYPESIGMLYNQESYRSATNIWGVQTKGKEMAVHGVMPGMEVDLTVPNSFLLLLETLQASKLAIVWDDIDPGADQWFGETSCYDCGKPL
jgi:hypothetical protein